MTPSQNLRPSAAKSPSISQSEGKSAQKCGLRWFGQWHLALKHYGGDGPPARIGSMGHAIVAACEHDVNRLTDDLAMQAVDKENLHRGWWPPAAGPSPHHDVEMRQATDGARTLLKNVTIGSPARTRDGVKLIEHRLSAPWSDLVRVGLDARIAEALAACGRLGIEGQPDLVHLMLSTYGLETVYVDDFKFRQKPDLGGTLDKPNSSIVDPQGAFYEVLLRAAGVVADEPIIFRQVIVYAGPWLTADDFIDEDDRARATPEMRRTLTVESGLPSCDLSRLGALATAEQWSEAFRVLAERRYNRRLADYNARPAKSRAKPPVRLTENEEWTARRFIEELKTRQLVQEQRCPLDHDACLEVVQDMLKAVLAQEAQVARGLVPGRSLDAHPRGDCVRPYGCGLAVPCQASLGSNNAADVLRSHAEDGRLSLRVLPTADVGDEPAEK